MLNRSGNTTDNLCFRYRFRDVFSRFRCCVYNGTGPLFVHVKHNGNMELHVSATFQIRKHVISSCDALFPFPFLSWKEFHFSAIKKTFNRSACSQFIRLRRLIHANYSRITRSFFTFLKLLKIHAFDSVSPVLTPLNSQRLGSFSITCERSSHRRSAAVVLIDKSRFTYHGSATLQTARQKDKRGQINERLLIWFR